MHLHLGHAQSLELRQKLDVGWQKGLDRRVMVKWRRCVCRLGQADKRVGACGHARFM